MPASLLPALDNSKKHAGKAHRIVSLSGQVRVLGVLFLRIGFASCCYQIMLWQEVGGIGVLRVVRVLEGGLLAVISRG
jgi:hypothetical protein